MQRCYFRPLKWLKFPEFKFVEVKFADMVPLTPSNAPTKFRWNNKNRFGEKCKNVISNPKTGRYFPRSRLFEDKVPLILSKVPTKFRWNNQNTLGEKCKNVISDP